VPELAPPTITARNRDQAEYLVRSRAQQRGVNVRRLDVAEAGPGAWFVTVTVDESDAARLAAAALDEDTQVLHFRTHPSRPTASDG
jgi:sarcosine oxidase gamma subunit